MLPPLLMFRKSRHSMTDGPEVEAMKYLKESPFLAALATRLSHSACKISNAKQRSQSRVYTYPSQTSPYQVVRERGPSPQVMACQGPLAGFQLHETSASNLFIVVIGCGYCLRKAVYSLAFFVVTRTPCSLLGPWLNPISHNCLMLAAPLGRSHCVSHTCPDDPIIDPKIHSISFSASFIAPVHLPEKKNALITRETSPRVPWKKNGDDPGGRWTREKKRRDKRCSPS